MDELLSLKGLITITVSSLISIKALRINFRVSKDINVGGNGNTVIVNQALAPTQKSFKLLWQILVSTIALTYPLLGSHYNSILAILALICTPLAVISFIVTVRGFGLSRLPDIFYIVGTALSCWLAFHSIAYLGYTVSEASKIYPAISYLGQNGLSSIAPLTTLTGVVIPLACSCLTVIGFAALSLSLLYFVFAYLTARSFDDAVRFSLRYGVMAILGFFVACSGFTALGFRNFPYIRDLLVSVMPT
jgi:hypothetical protein